MRNVPKFVYGKTMGNVKRNKHVRRDKRSNNKARNRNLGFIVKRS